MKLGHIGVGLGVVALAVGGWLGYATFQHLRRESMDKAISSYLIKAGAGQYFLENPAAKSIRYDQLIGPECYVRGAEAVDGEDYHELFPIPRDFRELALTMRGGRRVIIFDSHTLRQDADGSFPARYNPDPAAVAAYQAWIKAGRPPLPPT